MILLTGGSGRLGIELRKHIEFFDPKRNHVNILWQDPLSAYPWCKKELKLIVHCAAYTDVLKAETEKEICYQTNVIGTRNLASLGIPLIYISTEYVFDGTKGNYDEEDYPNPQNFYSLTKLLGEYEARRSPRSVVMRCLFKPRPFEHANACIDQFTSGDYVDVIAREIAIAIKEFDKLPTTIHIGTGRKSTFELAKQSRDVGEITVGQIEGVKLPKDTSLNTARWEKFKRENRLCEV